MIKRDYLQDQIQQLGKVLGKILAELLGTSLDSDINDVIVDTEQALEEHLDIRLRSAVRIDDREFIDFLSEKNIKGDSVLEQMATLLFELGLRKKEMDDDDGARLLMSKARVLYQFLAENAATYSFDWMYKIQDLDDYLESGNTL
ncbi:hypothetical protein [Fulvivirga sedimenti]|uniref:Uncharacterized protein n=1 Tax=Fulvivirga sedimenti TaxID=2879465 RepID=A0A9X1HR16_9BACT|nr:hypothetical protein [Fulvivirga sedimenti]MCA6074974.1 hypothetical protein [Fulvivirga sedimenti]MCA6076151.1 hypothetical protein [Fulvivirga sedimenti]MCA6077279.1 hypothetical protein [Fulvivirga sedimenti]